MELRGRLVNPPASMVNSKRLASICARTGFPRSVIKTMMRSITSRRRLRLWLKDSCCWWCGRETTLSLNARGAPSAMTLTIDHLKTRLAGRAKGEKTPTLGACSSCNKLRSEIEQALLHGKAIHPDHLTRFTRNTPPELMGRGRGPVSLFELPGLTESVSNSPFLTPREHSIPVVIGLPTT